MGISAVEVGIATDAELSPVTAPLLQKLCQLGGASSKISIFQGKTPTTRQPLCGVMHAKHGAMAANFA
jgi:hypothetical protein